MSLAGARHRTTALFVGCAIGKVSVDEMLRGIWPFYYDVYGADHRDLRALAVAGAAKGARVLEQTPQFAGRGDFA
jgi:hypothetical protein